jgi:hypothetical protein
MSCLGHVLNRTPFWDDFHHDVCLRSIQRQGFPQCRTRHAGKNGRKPNVCKACSGQGPRGCRRPRSCCSARWCGRDGDRRQCWPRLEQRGARALSQAFLDSRLRPETIAEALIPLGIWPASGRPTKFKIFLMEAGMPDVSRRRVADERAANSPKPCGSFPEIRTDLPLGHARGSLRTAGVTLACPRSAARTLRCQAESASAVVAVDR